MMEWALFWQLMLLVIAFAIVAGGTRAVAWALLHFDRLTATWEAAALTRSLESLTTAAYHLNELDEGRDRERVMVALRQRLDHLGVGAGADENPEAGERGVFTRDGTYTTPNGTQWQFSSED
jgi:hypothetical protein